MSALTEPPGVRQSTGRLPGKTMDNPTPEQRIERLECIVRSLWKAVCQLQECCKPKRRNVKGGYVSSVTATTNRILGGRVNKSKRVSAAVVYTSGRILTGSVAKRKSVSAAVSYHAGVAFAGSVHKIKAILSSVLYTPGGLQIAGQVTKSKALSSVVAYTTGKYAGSGANAGSVVDQAWTNPGNATGPPDGSYATALLVPATNTQFLQLTNYGGLIPAGATPDGIVVDVTAQRTGSGTITDLTVQLVLSGTPVGSNKAMGTTVPGSPTVMSYGGTGDTWSASLTDSDLNNSAFGVILQYTNASGATPQAEVDSARITVYYH